MAETINLNRARKARAKAGAARQAARNRAVFGRGKAAKAADRAAREKAQRALDQSRREP